MWNQQMIYALAYIYVYIYVYIWDVLVRETYYIRYYYQRWECINNKNPNNNQILDYLVVSLNAQKYISNTG